MGILVSVFGIIRSSLIFQQRAGNNAKGQSKDINLMTGLTSAPEGSGSLAKLQLLHELLQLRSC